MLLVVGLTRDSRRALRGLFTLSTTGLGFKGKKRRDKEKGKCDRWRDDRNLGAVCDLCD